LRRTEMYVTVHLSVMPFSFFAKESVCYEKVPPPASGLRRRFAVTAALSVLPLCLLPSMSRADSTRLVPVPRQLHGNIPNAVADAQTTGVRLDPQADMELALTLPPRNKAEMDDYVQRLYDPADPLYKHYLTPQEVQDRFSPTQADYNAVVAFAKSKGLTVTQTWQNRNLVDVSGPANVVEAAFGIHLMHFVDRIGRDFYAPDAEPSVPADIAPRLLGVIGLDNAGQWQTQIKAGRKVSSILKAAAPGGGGDGGGGTGGGGGSTGGGGGSTSTLQTTSNNVTGSGALPGPPLSGPGGGFAPKDIKTAYNLNSVPSNGGNGIVALVELNGFNPSDIQTYEDTFGLPHIPIQIISIDGSTNTIDYSNQHNSYIEPVLDLDMVVAIAPGIRLIRVYQGVYGPSNGSSAAKNLLDVYNRVGADLNEQTSISFGTGETGISSSMKQSENTAFENGALTGNSIFASSGDSGTLNGLANDPAAQPFVCGVGGTTVNTDQYANWLSETTWSETFTLPTGSVTDSSGGGVSDYWAISPFQKSLVSNGSGASTSARNVPDVALNAFANYSIYSGGSWFLEGGTSAAAPIWAAFTALVNGRVKIPRVESRGLEQDSYTKGS